VGKDKGFSPWEPQYIAKSRVSTRFPRTRSLPDLPDAPLRLAVLVRVYRQADVGSR
jgi:hypothetical protein